MTFGLRILTTISAKTHITNTDAIACVFHELTSVLVREVTTGAVRTFRMRFVVYVRIAHYILTLIAKGLGLGKTSHSCNDKQHDGLLVHFKNMKFRLRRQDQSREVSFVL